MWQHCCFRWWISFSQDIFEVALLRSRSFSIRFQKLGFVSNFTGALETFQVPSSCFTRILVPSKVPSFDTCPFWSRVQCHRCASDICSAPVAVEKGISQQRASASDWYDIYIDGMAGWHLLGLDEEWLHQQNTRVSCGYYGPLRWTWLESSPKLAGWSGARSIVSSRFSLAQVYWPG